MSSYKNSVRKFDLPIERFGKVTLQFLDQLNNVLKNLLKHKREQDWRKLQIETLKGKQIVSQIQSAIREIDEVMQTLTPSEASEFAHKIEPFKTQAVQAIKKFMQSNEMRIIQDASAAVHVETEDSSWGLIERPSHEQLTQDIQFLPEEIEVEQRRAQLETVQNLQHDMEELHELFSEFAQQVHEQGTAVNNIEEHVETALENVKEGEKTLAKAAKLKTVLYPLTGALIGTCIGGPVGLLAGLKIGGLAAFGGTVLGFTGGRAIKNWHEKAVDSSAHQVSLVKSQTIATELNSQSSTTVNSIPHSTSFT